MFLAALLLFFCSHAHAQVHQEQLFLDDGTGKIAILSGLGNGGGTFTFPPGGGTILTTTASANITTLGTIASGTWDASTIGAAYGGTGLAIYTPYAVLAGGTTTTGNLQQVSNASAIGGMVLTYVSSSALPTWQNSSAGFTNPMSVLGDMMYENSTPVAAKLSGNTSSTKEFLISTGASNLATAPVWGTIAAGDMPVFVKSGSGDAAGAVPAPGTTGGTTRYLREDATWVAPAAGGNAELGGCTSLQTLSTNPSTDYWDPDATSGLSAGTANVANSDVMLVTRSGTIKNFFIALSAKTGNPVDYWIFTLRDVTTGTNGPTTNVGGTSLTGSDVTTNLSVNAGDQITLTQTYFGTPSNATTATWAFELQ